MQSQIHIPQKILIVFAKSQLCKDYTNYASLRSLSILSIFSCFEICCPNHLTTQLLMGNSLSFSLFRVQWGCRLLPLICSSNPQYTSKISGIQNIVILNKYNTSMLALYYLELWVTTKSDKISTYNLTVD